MGCAGSKSEVYPDQLNPKNLENSDRSEEPSHLKEDEEVHVLVEGKSINKTVLDEITDKKINHGKPSQSSNQGLNEGVKKINSVHISSDVHEETKYHSSNNLSYQKSETNKLSFENHPHEFDFSFIDEKTENKERQEIEDRLFEEMRDVN